MVDREHLRFPARDLKPYIRHVSIRKLEVGVPYFHIAYMDETMLVPELTPLIFAGRNLSPDDHNRRPALFYFQDFASYSAGIRYDTFHGGSDEECEFDPVWNCYEERGATVSGICEFEEAINCLLRCSL